MKILKANISLKYFPLTRFLLNRRRAFDGMIIFCIGLMACDNFFQLPKQTLLGKDFLIEIKDTSAVIQNEFIDFDTNESVIQYGHCWAIAENPTIVDFKTTFGETNEKSIFKSQINGLQPNTRYFIRAYFQTKNGVRYNNPTIFWTETDNRFPIISLVSVDDIGKNTASSTAALLRKGEFSVVTHGHCWATIPEPTVQNSKTNLGIIQNEVPFNSVITSLSANTTYYLRAYIQFKKTPTSPEETVYSNEVNFKTVE